VIIVNQLNSPSEFLQELKKRTNLLVTIDDAGPGAVVADIRFNPEYYLPDSYFGPEFVPLRQEFQDFNKKNKESKKQVESILVTLGGSDTYGFLPKVVQALSGIPKTIEVKVIIGPAFNHHTQLDEVIKRANRPFTVLKSITNMAEFLFNSDLVVCSAGLTLFEAACVGTPAVVVCGELFEEETAKMMKKNGFGINLGFGKNIIERIIFKKTLDLIMDFDRRKKMSQIGRKLVTGCGCERIAKIILEGAKLSKK
ncbi:unnamed protein product, partial [marine sediment metagenome]